MTTQFITEVWQKMIAEANSISAQMIDIENKHPECEAPEFMIGQDLEDWNMLYRLRKGIYNRQNKIENCIEEFAHFYEMELK